MLARLVDVIERRILMRFRRRRAAAAVAAASSVAVVATAIGVAMANKRWGRAGESADEDLYVLPDVERLTVRARDGAELAVVIAGGASSGTDAERPTVVLSHCWTGDTRFWAPLVKLLVPD